jgi:hypothetical protein
MGLEKVTHSQMSDLAVKCIFVAEVEFPLGFRAFRAVGGML